MVNHSFSNFNVNINTKHLKTPEISNMCGFKLKHGTIIIGVIQSILAFMFLILSAAYAEHPHELIDMSDPSIVPETDTLRILLIIIAVFSGLLCIFSIMIIFGAETNRPYLILPWLIANPIVLIVYIASTLIAIIHHTGADRLIFVIGHLIVALCVALVAIYNLIAVNSYYKHLKSLNF